MARRMRRRLLLLVAIVAGPVALWAVLPVGSAGSPSAGEIARAIARKEAQIRVHRGREAVLTTDISRFTHRIDALQADISHLQLRETRLESDLVVKQAQLAQVQTHLREERLRLAKLKARLAQARIVLARRLVEIYKADRPDLITVVLEAKGFQDLLERTDFMHRISTEDARIIAAVTSAKAEATATARRLAGLEQREARVAGVIRAERDQVAAVKGELIDRRTSYESARAQKARLLSSSRLRRHKLEDDVAGLRRQQEAIQAQLARAASAGAGVGGPIRHGSGALIWPVNGPITSPFCARRPWEACHPGVDIGVPSGTPVRAAAAGRVVLEQSEAQSGGYGNFVCIQHSGALSTCYAHLMRFTIGMGAVVSQGQVIAISDCTGRCFGPHLHFETRINGRVVNPMNYL